MPESPTGHTSSRRNWKIRNISAVHRPMPRTTERRVMTSSSASRPMRSNGTVPSTTFAARSRIEATFLPESPAARSFLGGTAKTASGERSPSNNATNRPWMARAAAPASCWCRILSASAAKWLVDRRGRWKGLVLLIRLAITRSRRATSAARRNGSVRLTSPLLAAAFRGDVPAASPHRVSRRNPHHGRAGGEAQPRAIDDGSREQQESSHDHGQAEGAGGCLAGRQSDLLGHPGTGHIERRNLLSYRGGGDIQAGRIARQRTVEILRHRDEQHRHGQLRAMRTGPIVKSQRAP